MAKDGSPWRAGRRPSRLLRCREEDAMTRDGRISWPATTRRGLLARAQGAAALPGLAGLIGSALLAACAMEGAAAPESATKQRQPATIRFAAAGVGTELEIWTEVTNAYNALGTGITVQYEPCTAGSASAQDCLPVYFAEYVAGSAPDVWRVDDEPLPFYADKGIYLE